MSLSFADDGPSSGAAMKDMSPVRRAIPDAAALLAAIDAGCTNRTSGIHGQAHWRAVAWTGCDLLAGEPDADPAVVLLFAMFHDSMRLDDGHDPRHGPRAAVFARSLHGRFFHLPDDRLRWLELACDGHTTERHSGNPTTAVCWDADRLNLWRIGVRPDPHYLSTEVARRPEIIRQAERLEGQWHDWATIVERYETLRSTDGP
jgi:uncharacterized protein